MMYNWNSYLINENPKKARSILRNYYTHVLKVNMTFK